MDFSSRELPSVLFELCLVVLITNRGIDICMNPLYMHLDSVLRLCPKNKNNEIKSNMPAPKKQPAPKEQNPEYWTDAQPRGPSAGSDSNKRKTKRNSKRNSKKDTAPLASMPKKLGASRQIYKKHRRRQTNQKTPLDKSKISQGEQPPSHSDPDPLTTEPSDADNEKTSKSSSIGGSDESKSSSIGGSDESRSSSIGGSDESSHNSGEASGGDDAFLDNLERDLSGPGEAEAPGGEMSTSKERLKYLKGELAHLQLAMQQRRHNIKKRKHRNKYDEQRQERELLDKSQDKKDMSSENRDESRILSYKKHINEAMYSPARNRS